MSKLVKEVIHANGIDIGIYTEDFQNEYISITDIARYKSDEPKDVIKNCKCIFLSDSHLCLP